MPVRLLELGRVTDATDMNVPEHIALSGNHAFVTTKDGVSSVDVSDPRNPTISDSLVLGSLGARGIAIDGSHAYVVNDDGTLFAVDISTPTALALADSIDLAGDNTTKFVSINGTHAYVTDSANDTVYVVDISTPTALSQVGSITDTKLGGAWGIHTSGNHAYIAASTDDRLVVLDISTPSSPTIAGSVQDGTDLNEPRHIAQQGSKLFVTASLSDAVTSIDITDPTAPFVISSVTDTDLNEARGISLFAENAYVVRDGIFKVVVVDISDSSAMVVRGSILSGTGAWALEIVVDGDGRLYSHGGTNDRFVVGTTPGWPFDADTEGFSLTETEIASTSGTSSLAHDATAGNPSGSIKASASANAAGTQGVQHTQYELRAETVRDNPDGWKELLGLPTGTIIESARVVVDRKIDHTGAGAGTREVRNYVVELTVNGTTFQLLSLADKATTEAWTTHEGNDVTIGEPLQATLNADDLLVDFEVFVEQNLAVTDPVGLDLFTDNVALILDVTLPEVLRGTLTAATGSAADLRLIAFMTGTLSAATGSAAVLQAFKLVSGTLSAATGSAAVLDNFQPLTGTLSAATGSTADAHAVKFITGTLSAATGSAADLGKAGEIAGTLTAATGSAATLQVIFFPGSAFDTVIWGARRDPDEVFDQDLVDVSPLKVTVKRLADSATILFTDPNGTKQDDYPRGQRVSLFVTPDGGATQKRKWAGMVVDTVPLSRGGADYLRVKLVGYDHFLTSEGIYKTYTSQSVEAIAQDVIESFTPINWDANNVDFFDGTQTITRTFRGETPHEALDFLVSLSDDEEYGVDNDLVFFVKRREVTPTPDDVIEGDWHDYDLPEVGSEAYNKVKLFYGESPNQASVVVEDRGAQEELRDKLGAPRRVIRALEDHYPEITSESVAEAKAREILNRRRPFRTGTITSFERFDNEPGDVMRVEIQEKGIDTEFRIAMIEYDWTRDETLFTIVEEGPDVERLLLELTDQVHRINVRGSDPDSVEVNFLDIQFNINPTFTVTARKRTVKADVFILGPLHGSLGAVEGTMDNPVGDGGRLGARFNAWTPLTL